MLIFQSCRGRILFSALHPHSSQTILQACHCTVAISVAIVWTSLFLCIHQLRPLSQRDAMLLLLIHIWTIRRTTVNFFILKSMVNHYLSSVSTLPITFFFIPITYVIYHYYFDCNPLHCVALEPCKYLVKEHFKECP